MLSDESVRAAVGDPLFYSKHIPFCFTDIMLRFCYVSDLFCEISGYSRDELIGSSVALLLGKRKMLAAYREFLFYMKNRKNNNHIWRVRDKNGRELVSKIEASQISVDGKSYTLTITLDYTEFQQSIHKIEASEEKYRLLTETMPHIVWTNDINGRPIYMNDVALNYFGKTEHDFEHWNWLDFFDLEEARDLEREWDIASRLENPVQKVIRIKRKTGQFKWFQIVLYPQHNEADETISWTAIATDIDDRIKAEEKLAKTNKRLRSLIDASPIPIYSLSDQGIVKDLWNPAAERILGWKKDEVIGKLTPLASEEYMDQYHENLTLIKKRGQLRKVAKRRIRDGSEITIEVNSGCIYDIDGNIEEIMIMLLDITQQENQKIHLQESLNEKRTLLQEIHHRVKNNLAIVVSLLQLQVYQTDSEKEKNKLLDAQNRVMSIAMVHELLYSTDEFSKVDLRSYYEQLIKTIKSNMITGIKNVHHKLDIRLKSLNITQAIPLGLLINELITNSLKYAFPIESEENNIQLSIYESEGFIKVDYSDNGTGFDMSENGFSAGLGFKIMDSLLNQLDAKYEMKSDQGFHLSFEFRNIWNK